MEDFLAILIEKSNQFLNKKILLDYLRKTFLRNKLRLSPITPKNDNETAAFVKVGANGRVQTLIPHSHQTLS